MPLCQRRLGLEDRLVVELAQLVEQLSAALEQPNRPRGKLHGHRAVGTLTNANLLELTTDPFNPKGKSTRIASVGIFYWHTYDHYGQMVEYLRMNGLKPPASR